MTDRINYLTVALEKDTRSDDCEPLISAIRMMRGVAAVDANVVSPSDWTAEARARQSLSEKLWNVLNPNA